MVWHTKAMTYTNDCDGIFQTDKELINHAHKFSLIMIKPQQLVNSPTSASPDNNNISTTFLKNTGMYFKRQMEYLYISR